MNNAANYQELARKYGLAAAPECVLRLTKLVARQDSDMDEIARVISGDLDLRARLLRVANPDAESEADYTVDTVEDALMRNGVGCALLLAMGTPLSLALVKTFQTMLSLKLTPINRRVRAELEGEHLLGTISFSGKASGRVYLRLSLASARRIASAILGMNPKELEDGAEIRDAIGEVLNIMTGNFQSNMCDAGLDCRLNPPDVKRTSDLHTPRPPDCGLECMAFRSGEIVLFVDITVNPWND
jgi:CheY-specific phosphatase CheX